MSATLVQALIGQAGDDPAIDRTTFRACLQLYDADAFTAADVKAALALTEDQGTELDEILATRPTALVSILVRAQWVHKIDAIFDVAALGSFSGFMSANDVRAQLGLS